MNKGRSPLENEDEEETEYNYYYYEKSTKKGKADSRNCFRGLGTANC